MIELNEEQAIQLAIHPEKIIDAYTCNLVLGFLNGVITDMTHAEFECEMIANNHRVKLLHQEDKTVALKEAEFKISEEYKKWREMQHSLQKFKAYRYDLRHKEEMLKYQSQQRPNNSHYSI